MGNIHVGQGMFDGADLIFSCSSAGNISVGGPMDSLAGGTVVLNLDDTSMGSLSVNGHLYDVDVDIETMHSAIQIRGAVVSSSVDV